MKKCIYGFLLVVAVATSLCGCGSNSGQQKDAAADVVNEVEQHSVAPDTAISRGVQVIDFYATWCGPCKRLAPILENLEKKYDGKIVFRRVDIDQNPDMAAEYNVQAVPTLVIIDGEVKDVIVGLLSEEDLDARLAKFVK